MNQSSLLTIVLVEPEIPGNTGTIGRLCVGLELELILVEPLGFSLEDKYMRRAGLDYWKYLNWRSASSLAAVQEEVGDPTRFYYFTTKTERSYTQTAFRSGDYLVFGKETKGLPEALLGEHPDQCRTIPMYGKIRSHNLAVAAGVVAYEAMRQIKGF